MEDNRDGRQGTVCAARPRVLLSILMALALVTAVGVAVAYASMTARAATADASVSWIIPSDKTISISYPTALTAVQFSPSTGTFARQAADSQGASGTPAAFRVTNDGNVAVQIAGAFTATFASGIAEFRIANASSGGAPSGGQIWWCGSTSDTGDTPAGSCSGTNNETTSRPMMGVGQELGIGATHDWWAWSWGTSVAPGTSTKTLRLTSS